MGEGMNSSVAVTETTEGVRKFHVSGKVEASRARRTCGCSACSGTSRPCCTRAPFGADRGLRGRRHGGFVGPPRHRRIVICEIEPFIPRVVARYFGSENHGVVDDPRVEVVYDNARHYMLTTREKFDIITSDPIHPWVKGAATLYTREYFEHCRRTSIPVA